MDWWHYIEECSEVPTAFEVVVTALTLGGDHFVTYPVIKALAAVARKAALQFRRRAVPLTITASEATA